MNEAYVTPLRDWLACASAGRGSRAGAAARSLGGGTLERVAAAATAGHVLDFDDTYTRGLAHLSAPTAPAALVLAAERGLPFAAALDAYAAGFEAMAGVAAASHPALYERGWHPTAVCGPVGAAVAAARVLALDPAREEAAVALALLRAGGTRAGFGADGKSIAVGRAAAEGVAAALLAESGATVPLERAVAGFEVATGGRYAGPPPTPAVGENWIKAYPCCLQTHTSIEASAELGDASGPVPVRVHPLSLAAAMVADPADGLEAKFSIGYLVAFTLLHGPPAVDSFDSLDDDARSLARERVRVEADASLGESEAVVGEARVEFALGSPARPMSSDQLDAKVRGLAGDRLPDPLFEPGAPARALLDAAGI